MSNGELPLDDNNKPSVGLWDSAGHQIVPAQAVSVATDSTGQKYGVMNVNASFSASSLAINDPTTTTQKAGVNAGGSLQVAGQGTAGTPAGGVISIQGVASGTAIPISGSITATNPSVGSTGAAVPASGTYMTGNKAGNLTGVSLDGSGNLNVNVAAGGSGSNASVGTDGSAIPASSTLVGASDGTNLQQLLVESAVNRNLRTGIYSGANEATVTGANALKVDNSAVTQPVSGTVTANAGTGSFTVAQATGTNLHAVLDSGSTTAVTSLPAIPAGASTIGAVTQASGPWTDNITQVGGSAITLGSKVSASSFPVVVASDQGAIAVLQSCIVSTLNSSTATLTANSVFTGTSESSLNFSALSIGVFANVASATGGLSVQQSQDGANWDTIDTFSIVASTTFNTTVNLVAQFFRIVYTNGATNQATFRLQTIKQPVDVVLPRTLTVLGDLKTSLQEVNGAALSLGQTTMAASLPVTLASNQPNQNVTIQATSGTALVADQTNSELRISNYVTKTTAGDTALTLGSATSVNSLPVVIASDQAAVASKLSTVAAYTQASTATSGATQNSSDIAVGSYREISIDINTTAQAGTAPTIQYFYERKGADGIYYVLWQSAVLTAAANTLSTSIGAGMAYNQSLGLTGRLRWVVGGSATPTYTHSINAYGK